MRPDARLSWTTEPWSPSGNASLRRVRSRDDVTRMISRLREWNANQTARNTADMIDEGVDLVKTNAPTVFKAYGKSIARIYQSGGKSTKGNKKKQREREVVSPEPE